MRNLISASHLTSRLDLPLEFGTPQYIALDEDGCSAYVAGSGFLLARLETPKLEVVWSINFLELAASIDDCVIPPDAGFAAAQYSPDLDALTIALTSGHLFLLYPDPKYPQKSTLEEIGFLEGGVATACWSPDGEAFAVLSSFGQLLLMTPDWQVLWEVDVRSNDPEYPQPTAPPAPEQSVTSQPPMLDPSTASVSWRGDARYLATCTLDADLPLPPRVRVWDKEGGLHALGEVSKGVGPSIAWQPNGRHLYVAQHREQEETTNQPGLDGAVGGGVSKEELIASGPQGAQGQAPEVRHVGAWKRELRRREAVNAAAGGVVGPNKILLYERNGLQHGEINVETDPGMMIDSLHWSPDSQLLAVVLKPKNEFAADTMGTTQCRILQILYRSNWHWYVKYERRFTGCRGPLVVAWELGGTAQGTTLWCVSDDLLATKCSFTWESTVSDFGSAAVVDGTSVMITPFRQMMIPPPLCAAAMVCPSSVVSVAFRDTYKAGALSTGGDGREAVAALLSDGRVAVVESVEEDLWEETLEEQLEEDPWTGLDQPKLRPTKILTLPETVRLPGKGMVLRQLAWVGGRESALVILGSDVEGDFLVELNIDSSGAAGNEHLMTRTPGPVVRCLGLTSYTEGPGVIIEIQGGAIYKYTLDDGPFQPIPDAFPTTCPRIAVCSSSDDVATLQNHHLYGNNGGSQAPHDVIIGLSFQGHLYWGQRLVATSVTSFAVRYGGPGGGHLLYTTAENTLITLKLRAQTLQEISSSSSKPSDIAVRAVEEGASLVAVPTGGATVVCQAPRGNLELVRPRALVIPAVAAALDAGDYAWAWTWATRDRLDLNILVDYRWPAILNAGEVDRLLMAIGSDLEAADFVACLNAENIAAPGGIYHAVLAGHEGAALPHTATAMAANKLSVVCGALRKAARSLDEANSAAVWLRTELTTYSKVGDLAQALGRIKEIRESELNNAGGGQTGSEIARPTAYGAASSEQGLRHVLMHSSEEEVYKAALGSYELELAYMVVTHSQRDPGEFLVQLQQFAEIEDINLRRYEIDLHLRRYEGAVRHLWTAGPGSHFDLAVDLARKYGLLRLLASLAVNHPDLRARVQVAIGEELQLKGRNEDAALAFMTAGDLENAMRAYRLAGQWRPALTLAARLGRSSERITAMAARMAVDLADGHRHSDAAAVTLEYLNDIESGVRLLAEGGQWREAVRVAVARGAPQLMESVIAPTAAAAASRILESAREDAERVGKYWDRLKELRQRREAMIAAIEFADGHHVAAGNHFGDVDALASEAASVVSGLSVYTDATRVGSGSFSTSAGGSGVSVTTVGGRRRSGTSSKTARRRKIRQGSPEEEAELGRLLLGLAPLPAVLTEAGELTELLVMLGHEQDAAEVQRALKALTDAHREAVDDLLAHPPPGMGLALSADAIARAAEVSGPVGVEGLRAVASVVPGLELQRRAAELEAEAKSGNWKWEVLRDHETKE